jgi:hypothetical protein
VGFEKIEQKSTHDGTQNKNHKALFLLHQCIFTLPAKPARRSFSQMSLLSHWKSKVLT